MTEEEAIEFFSNPIIQKELELTRANTRKSVATEILREQLMNYIQRTKCTKINIQWTKENGFKEYNIRFID